MNICTWIHEEEIFRETDWQCAAVFFATSRRQNPMAGHILFTSAAQVPSIRGFDLEGFLRDKLKVRIERVPLTYRTPFGFHGMRKNPVYLFDVIKRICETETDETAKYVVLRPDCVWIRPASIIDSQLERYGLLTMAVEDADDPDVQVNGLSRLQMRVIYEEMLGEPVPLPPEYCGSECIAATLREIRRVVPELDRVWSASLERFRANRPRLADESHMLSFVYHKLGSHPRTANPFIRRIRTRSDGNARKDDLFLTVWHLPNESNTGIRNLYRDAIRPRSLFWDGRPGVHREYLARTVGISRKRGSGFIRSVRNLVYRKLLKSDKRAKDGPR
ncbi:hypothetical protein GE107_20055 [Cohnella sp. CFH 77786]|uniref:hypothetical protein n=1 Tax=Cohnella sp. CFH 77786 TaxID=2662265 RepID=UPI001C6102C7|nr:hypothetical protein [Cohnella sp. CFH 77786]MBW5448340.1 hypothetical protein [Cohnella sp. CFH 77786]